MTISMRQLLAMFVAASVAMLALIKATPWSAELLYFTTWTTWTAFAIAALALRSEWKYFAMGFTLAGASYVLTAWGASSDRPFPLDIVLAHLYSLAAVENTGELHIIPNSSVSWRDVSYSLDQNAFFLAGRCLFTILIGYIGGKFAVFLYRNRKMEERSVAGA